MPQTLSKVIYKPDPQSTDEYTVFVNPSEYEKWKAGDRSIPLVEVVETFKVLHSNQGSQGKLGEASKQQRENMCGSTHDDDAVLFILENGVQQAGDAIQNAKWGSKNDARGSSVVDSRGKGLRGI
ncbi:hypothetical protein ONZ45_g13029 [Pleurotus djamor]|nr:hypothetical protein ONZ45_g13029 [Pleurotus djamor]